VHFHSLSEDTIREPRLPLVRELKRARRIGDLCIFDFCELTYLVSSLIEAVALRASLVNCSPSKSTMARGVGRALDGLRAPFDTCATDASGWTSSAPCPSGAPAIVGVRRALPPKTTAPTTNPVAKIPPVRLPPASLAAPRRSSGAWWDLRVARRAAASLEAARASRSTSREVHHEELETAGWIGANVGGPDVGNPRARRARSVTRSVEGPPRERHEASRGRTACRARGSRFPGGRIARALRRLLPS